MSQLLPSKLHLNSNESLESRPALKPGFVSIKLESPLKRKRTYKIIILGDSAVGKTCITSKFCHGKFPENSESTVGLDFREKNVQVANECIKIQIWDTAGQERFRKSMVPHYYRNVQAVIYVYDITRKSTFDNIISWMAECELHNPGKQIPAILVGNKRDAPPHLREVHSHVAMSFAKLHEMEFFETSAKDEAKINSHELHIQSNSLNCDECDDCQTIDSVFVTLICKLLLLRTGQTPVPEEPVKLNLIEMKPVMIKGGNECVC